MSAGVALYRGRGTALEVLLVHPGGPFWQRKDEGAWSLPKGEVAPGESLEAVARREFREETGHDAPAILVALTPVRQAGGKIVHPFAGEGDLDPAACAATPSRWSGRRAPAAAHVPRGRPRRVVRPPTAAVKLLAGQRPVLAGALRARGARRRLTRAARARRPARGPPTFARPGRYRGGRTPRRSSIAVVIDWRASKNPRHGSLRRPRQARRHVAHVEVVEAHVGASSSLHAIGIATGALARARTEYGAIAVAPSALRR